MTSRCHGFEPVAKGEVGSRSETDEPAVHHVMMTPTTTITLASPTGLPLARSDRFDFLPEQEAGASALSPRSKRPVSCPLYLFLVEKIERTLSR